MSNDVMSSVDGCLLSSNLSIESRGSDIPESVLSVSEADAEAEEDEPLPNNMTRLDPDEASNEGSDADESINEEKKPYPKAHFKSDASTSSKSEKLGESDPPDVRLVKRDRVSTSSATNDGCSSQECTSSSLPQAHSASEINSNQIPSMPGAFAIENPLFESLERRRSASFGSYSDSIATYGHNTDDRIAISEATPPLQEQMDRDTEEGMVVRAVRVEEHVFEAKLVDQNSTANPLKRLKKCWWLIAIAVTLIVVITLAILLTKESEVDETNEVINETTIHSTESSRVKELRAILAPLNGDGVFDKNSTEFSPDRLTALNWLVTDDYFSRYSFDEFKIRQRYIVTLLYFSTNGQEWINQLSFLSDRDVCDWSAVKTVDRGNQLESFVITGVICNKLGQVETIKIEGNNLSGTIPPEIRHFSDTIMEISLGEGMLSGTIPSSFEEFKALEIFDVNSNCLSGPIPNLSRIPSIRRLSLENNLRLWGSLNGFCDHSEYNNPQIDFIRSTCGGCSGKEKSALIECDCCTCCNEEDLTCCDSQGVSSTTSQYGYSYSSPFECPA